jgi:hypothetical protein
MEVWLDMHKSPKTTTEAMALINSRFRAIPPLEEVVIEVFEEARTQDGYIWEEMKRVGWTISVKKSVEDSEDSDHISEDGDDESDYYDSDHYNYVRRAEQW